MRSDDSTSGPFGRVLRVLQLIQSRGRWDTKAIAQEIECSERTVYRDLAVLELAGVPWTYEKESSSYRVRPDYQFPILNLTDEELLGQATASSATKAPGLDINLGAKPASEKLAAKANDKSEHIMLEAQRFTEVLDLKLADHSRNRDVIRTVQWALIQKKQLTGQYQSPYEDKPLKLTLHPYRFCLVKSAWYLIGRTPQESLPRTYRIVVSSIYECWMNRRSFQTTSTSRSILGTRGAFTEASRVTSLSCCSPKTLPRS